MRWQGGRESTNVEDRRGRGPVVVGGGLGMLLIIVLGLFFGVDPLTLLDMAGQPQPGAQQAPAGGQEDELTKFVRVVLADTEDVWTDLFRRMGREYQDPKLVLFSGQTQSACGFASAAVGPFYCPADQDVYLDLSFFHDLESRFRAGGEFANAYVIAHEVGHHVQNLMGISDKIQAMRARVDDREYNALSVRLELQADCFAGIWAHHAQRMRQILEPGDIEDALNAASAIGDDRLQRESQGRVVPDSFTHGTSAQRVRWFKRGFESGDISQADTFSAKEL